MPSRREGLAPNHACMNSERRADVFLQRRPPPRAAPGRYNRGTAFTPSPEGSNGRSECYE
jgi:hypothetical protein